MSSENVCLCSKAASMKAPWSAADCFIVITGASRGFGRALCLQMVKRLTAKGDAAASIFMLLMARNMEALLETKKLVERVNSDSPDIRLTVVVADPPLDMSLADDQSLRKALGPLFVAYAGSQATRWLALVHNAASIGDITIRADERLSVDVLKDYYHNNLFAPMLLTSVFLQHFAPIHPSATPPLIVIVNIGSLAADKALAHMSDYCVGKAARQMYFQCLAVDRPTVAVFNYSPGPLNTDMYTELVEKLGNATSRAACAENKRAGRLVEPEESARVFVDWLRRMDVERENNMPPRAVVCPIHEVNFLNVWQGLRLDYFDVLNQTRP